MPTPSGKPPALPYLGGRVNIRDQVARTLRAALISGRVEPGTVYSMAALAAQIGVSSTPVREAVQELAREGLVEIVRNKGFRLVVLSDRELRELDVLLRLIEVPTVVSLAGQLRHYDYKRLRRICEDSLAAARRGDAVAYAELDLLFHVELVALAANSRLTTAVRDLRSLTLPSLQPSGAADHLSLLELLHEGDIAGAQQVATYVDSRQSGPIQDSRA